jgi:hypothetical protein
VTLVDTNILFDIWTDDPVWGQWSADALARVASRGVVVVNPVILAELARRFDAESDLTGALSDARVRRIPLPPAAAWPAAAAFAAYRDRGGQRSAALPDFFIGAHALVDKWPLLTRDATRYRTYFPSVKLIAPD